MALLDNNVKQLPGAKKVLGASFGLSAAVALLTAGQGLGLAFALTHLWEGEDLTAEIPWLALFLGCFLLRQVVTRARSGYLDAYARNTAAGLRQKLSDHLYQCGPAAVAQKGSGVVVATLLEGVDQVENYLALIIPKVTDLMVIPAVLAVVLLALDPMSGVISVVLIPCIVFYMRMLGSYAKENAAKQHGQFQRMSNHFADSLQGMATLKAAGRSRHYATTMYKTSEKFRATTVGTLKSATLSSLVLDLFRVFALAAVAIMLGFRLMAGNILLLPALAVLILVPEFFAPVRRYSTDFHASLDGRNQLQSVLDMLALPLDTTPCRCLPGQPGVPPTLDVNTICFSYGTNGEDHQALTNLSFSTRGPLKVGIIGTSGSGKSTLAHLLAGFASPTSGNFTVDGQETPTLSGSAWRQRVTFIPQDPHIFYGTLRDNVTFYCPDAPDQDIQQAIQLSGLAAVVDALPQGLDTIIGEGGRALSGGQAQRIALARAFLDRSRSVLVFDEPTAHLDIETEFALKERILPLMEGRLVFFSTHRLHWMQDMDLVLVLKDGAVVESGTLDQLRNGNGYFPQLAAQIAGGDRPAACSSQAAPAQTAAQIAGGDQQ